MSGIGCFTCRNYTIGYNIYDTREYNNKAQKEICRITHVVKYVDWEKELKSHKETKAQTVQFPSSQC